MKIVTIVGARPQFIKSAPVSFALKRAGVEEFVIHTGQHYDPAMSSVFFDEMEIPQPYVNLGVGSGLPGWQTARMLEAIENILLSVKPQWTLVYGDTTSTLAGALAASKQRVPLAHVESGLRSHNREMPEEYNRVLTDHCSDLLFCPTASAVQNLAEEGIRQGVHCVGDTMFDAVLRFQDIADRKSKILCKLGIDPGSYLLATLHRPYNTDDPATLAAILNGFGDLEERVVFPMHPRTRGCIAELLPGHAWADNVLFIEPVGYLDMLVLERNARMIITDSGGVQKEALMASVPCVTIRPETEWMETVQSGWNVLVAANSNQIVSAVKRCRRPDGPPPPLFGDGAASEKIAEILTCNLGR